MPEFYVNRIRDHRIADLNTDRVCLTRLIFLFAAGDRDVISRNTFVQFRNINSFCGSTFRHQSVQRDDLFCIFAVGVK